MPFKLPSELGDVSALINRCKAAVKKKQPWETHLSQCYRYAIPHRETFYNYSPGQKKNLDIYDSTAVIGTKKFASRTQATLTPAWRKWSVLSPGSEVPEKDKEEVQKQLDKITEIFFENINHSNYAQQAHEAFLDLAISTGALTMEESDGDSAFEFNAVPLAEINPEEGPRGTIETNWRKYKIAARMIERLWPGADLNENLRKLVNDSPAEDVEFIEGTVYEPKSEKYVHVVIYEDDKHLVYMTDYEVSPWIVFREMVVPGEVLGRGRVMAILPDILTANKVVEYVLRNAALAISGVYTSLTDGVFNPWTMRVAPGTAIPVQSNDNQNPTLRALERSGDFSVAELILSDLRANINAALFAAPFGDINSPVKSATEVSLRGQEALMDSGSDFGRLQTEFVEKVIKRGISILIKKGKIPAIRIDGKEVTIKHTSPLSRAQDQEDLLAYDQLMGRLAPLGQEVTALGIKIEDIPGYLANKLGIPQDLQREKPEREELMQMVAKMLADQQAAAQEAPA